MSRIVTRETAVAGQQIKVFTKRGTKYEGELISWGPKVIHMWVDHKRTEIHISTVEAVYVA